MASGGPGARGFRPIENLPELWRGNRLKKSRKSNDILSRGYGGRRSGRRRRHSRGVGLRIADSAEGGHLSGSRLLLLYNELGLAISAGQGPALFRRGFQPADFGPGASVQTSQPLRGAGAA